MTDASGISALLVRLTEGHVVCVGDLMLDQYVEGAVDRISPEAPIPVLAVRRESAMLGGVGNVLRNLAALGVRTDLVAAIGVDRAGRELAALLATEPGVTPHLTAVPERPTSIKTRFLAGRQQLLRADRETSEPLADAHRASLVDDARAALGESPGAVLALSDYGKGALNPTALETLICEARAAGHPVVVDPKGRDFARYRGATLITPNRHELAAATGLSTDDDASIVEACRKLAADAGVEAVLATRSEQGMTLVAGASVHHLSARARAVFDVSGAGDTVVALAAAAIAVGAPLEEAARIANVAAGVVVGKVGTAVAYPSEILSALHEGELMGAETKVRTLPALVEEVARWRRGKQRIGFTNGCFDLLHPGHVSLLNQARAACDRLIVGLNSDASVRRLKGEDRPVQSEASRAAVLASLAAVDSVVVFHEDTPMKLIEALRPELLVKGADYSMDEVVGGDLVRSWGGEVMLAAVLEGHSTTDTIKRMAS